MPCLKGGSITQFRHHFKTQKCLSVSSNNEIIVKFVTNYHPSAIKLSLVPFARDRVGRYGLKLKKCSFDKANVFQVIAFLFPKCASSEKKRPQNSIISPQ